MASNPTLEKFLIYTIGRLPGCMDPKKFAAALKREILEFGYSQDTAATDVRYDVICYLLTHTEDEKGFSLGKTMAEMWMKGCKPDEVRKYQDIVLMYCGMAINHLENVEEKTDGERQDNPRPDGRSKRPPRLCTDVYI